MELIKHIALGSLFILVGIGVLIFSINNPTESKVLAYTNWKGYLGGIAFILLGILEYFGYWKW
jgi:hypothetical protein